MRNIGERERERERGRERSYNKEKCHWGVVKEKFIDDWGETVKCNMSERERERK
jgi:hypothetical protein